MAAGNTSPKNPGSSKAYNMPVLFPNRLERIAEAEVVAMVTVSEAAEAEAKEQVDSAGKPEHAKDGAWLNPPSSPKVRVPDPLWPGAVMVTFSALGLREKSSMLRVDVAEAEAAIVLSPG